MADAATSTLGLSLPRDTFAKLTPAPFLLAHLKQTPPIRANGRDPQHFRKPTINIGSLTHSSGSAVVRVGDTAVVCAVRGEILLASDIPHPPNDDMHSNHLIEDLGLVVPNLELSTGCSPTHLPGNPPTSIAQSLSYRISSLIHESHLVHPADLRICYREPQTDNEFPDEESFDKSKAYWTLYIDILCLALDGNAFDAAWLAVVAALQNTSLPKAWWDPDEQSVHCSPLASESHRLRVDRPVLTASFAVFTTASSLKGRADAESWILADPDAFEEDICHETLTIALRSTEHGGKSVLRIEGGGGPFVSTDAMRRCISQAEQQLDEVYLLLA